MDVLDLKATLSLDTSQYESGLNGAEGKAKGFGGKLKSGLGKAAKAGAVAVAAVGTAAIATGGAVVKATGQVAEYGDNIEKMSQKMGMSFQAYQEWDQIMQHNGSSIDSVRTSMVTLAKQAGKNSDAFQALGISEEEVANLSQEELFNRVITGLQGMDEGLERTKIATELLGRGAKELGPLLNMSAEETEKMRQRTHELGGVMSDEAVKASAAYQDSLQDLQFAMSGIKRNAVANFLPGMVDVMDGLTSIFTGEKGGEGKIKKGIDSIIKAVGTNAPKLAVKAKQILKAVFEAVMDNLPDITTNMVNFFVSAVKGAVSAIPAMATAGIGILKSAFNAIMQAIPKLWGAIGKAVEEGLPKLVEAGLKMIKEFAENIGKGGGDITEAGSGLIGSLIKGLVDTIPILIQYVPQIIIAIVSAIIRMLPSVIKAGTKIVASLVKGIAKALPNIAKGLVKGAKDAIEKVKNLKWLNLGINIVKGIAKGIANSGKLIVDAAREAAKKAFNAAKDFLGISSPSKLFRTVIGQNIAAGMALGIEDKEPLVTRAISDIDSRMIEPYNETGIMDYVSKPEYETETFTDFANIPTNYVQFEPQTRDITIVLELDKTQLGKAVYKLNNEETQRVGVKLSGAYA